MIRELTVNNNDLAKEYRDRIMEFQGIVEDRFRAYQGVVEDAKKKTAELVEQLREIAKKDPEVLSQFRVEVRRNAIMIYVKR